MTNTLAYYGTELIAVKKFIVQALDYNSLKNGFLFVAAKNKLECSFPEIQIFQINVEAYPT